MLIPMVEFSLFIAEKLSCEILNKFGDLIFSFYYEVTG